MKIIMHSIIAFIVILLTVNCSKSEADTKLQTERKVNSVQFQEKTYNTNSPAIVKDPESLNVQINSSQDRSDGVNKEVRVLNKQNADKSSNLNGNPGPPDKLNPADNASPGLIDSLSSKAGPHDSTEIKREEQMVEENHKKINNIHDQWDDLLKKHVSDNGKVNYTGFIQDEVKLNEYCNTLSNIEFTKGLSRDEQLAFWINVYNAFTIKLILDNYPLKSILDLDNGKVWDRKWIIIAGKKYSLNNIEHEIIRPQFNEARIHFAVNCAAKSCPPLMNAAWTGENLEQHLEMQTRNFIQNEEYNEISEKELKLSKIFEWYAADFSNLKSFISKYVDKDIKAAAIRYQEYNWDLNE